MSVSGKSAWLEIAEQAEMVILLYKGVALTSSNNRQ